MNLSTPIESLPRVGKAYQKRLKKLGINTIENLLFHFPHRYEDFSDITPISQIKINQFCCIKGKILEIENNRTWKKKMILTQALVADKSGAIKVIWFNQPYLLNVLKPEDWVCLAGKISDREREIYLSNPVYEKLKSSNSTSLIHTGRLVPIYPETEGLSSRWLRFIIKSLLVKFGNKIPDCLPEKIRKEKGLLNIKEAIWQIHFPDSEKLAKMAKRRFAFEELFLIELLVLRERLKLSKEKAVPVPINLKVIKEFIQQLPFKLTNSQKKATWQILKDLEKTKPMNRLLEGDVGSGKTIVATIAALNVIRAGYQTVLMAPTEILAKQHFKTIKNLLKNFDIKIGLFTGKEKTKEAVQFLIGTHALIHNKLQFEKLALVIVDEQHRFGVEQRAKLIKNHKFVPHLLSMTATPIPRTLALTVYGDLDLSLLTEMPKGRKKVITKIVSDQEREKTYQFIREKVKEGQQVFVVCPRIESSNNKNKNWGEVKAVKEEYEKLSKTVFPDLKIGMLYGSMKTEKKEEIMKKFKNKKIDILISTSVIEVGIDVPTATIMMIEGAERFGLAQLHQFRGRVGRSDLQSYCFLFSDSNAKKTWQRLKALITSENGFELAEKDLEIRGPGDFSGKRQWGIPDLAMNSLKDVFLVEEARNSAKAILNEDPELTKYPLLKERLKETRKRIHLE